MKVFIIEYINPDSSENGNIYFVREDDSLPYHYLRVDNEYKIGDGRLLKKYCKRIDTTKNYYSDAKRYQETPLKLHINESNVISII